MSWRRREATIRQKALLFEWGLLPYHPISRGEASILIGRVLRGKKKHRRLFNEP